jgi:DNA-binding response OmpR family regulator
VEEKFTQPATASRGTETVLLAEDDEAVRNLTRSILEDFGYRVIEAADGEEAVRKFGDNKGAIDLLVLDIIMPKKNGKETYQEIRTIQPDIRALFTSGYTADIVHKKGILDTGLDFVLKPITPTAFLKKVREVLDRE